MDRAKEWCAGHVWAMEKTLGDVEMEESVNKAATCTYHDIKCVLGDKIVVQVC